MRRKDSAFVLRKGTESSRAVNASAKLLSFRWTESAAARDSRWRSKAPANAPTNTESTPRKTYLVLNVRNPYTGPIRRRNALSATTTRSTITKSRSANAGKSAPTETLRASARSAINLGNGTKF